ncbi:MAG: pyruvate formate lyase family protein, partial [Phycisphaerae bacterium]
WCGSTTEGAFPHHLPRLASMDRRQMLDTFRERLDDVIGRSGLTRSAFAAGSAIDRSTLSQLLSPTNRRLPRVETLAEVAATHQVSVDWLLGLSNAGPMQAEMMHEQLAFERNALSPNDERLIAWIRERGDPVTARFVRNHFRKFPTAEAVEAALPAASAARQEELRTLAASCRRVAHEPPRTFLDALHLLWFIDLGVQLADNAVLVGPGHLDRTLWPFYQRDLAAGTLTKEDALQLLEALYFHVNHLIPDGLAIPVMVGGRDALGRDVTNELSYLCLEALRRTKLVYPTVGVCWHTGTPADLTALAVDLISQGYATPALFGDDTIQRGLRLYGVPASESHLYINSTCVEITPVGASNVWVASPYFSTCQILLDEINAQAAATPAPTFDGFLAACLNRLEQRIVAEGVVPHNDQRELRRLNGGKPLQSVFTNDCIARGLDIDEGGARYNWVECSFVGLANLADSLHVIRTEIYERQSLDLKTLARILATNFQDCEPLRQRFLNTHAKYGNADPKVDALVATVVERIKTVCARHQMAPHDSHFVPGSFCWIMHEHLGRACGATPDGRQAGFSFADGAGPAQGRERHGPTSAILSTTSWDHAPLIGGVAYNMKFNRTLFDSPESTQRLEALLLTYLRRGGFEVQVNVVDQATLRQARENPEAYRDLVVRIGGYTDYFTRLSPGMQDEVMARTEFQKC